MRFNHDYENRAQGRERWQFILGVFNFSKVPRHASGLTLFRCTLSSADMIASYLISGSVRLPYNLSLTFSLFFCAALGVEK